MKTVFFSAIIGLFLSSNIQAQANDLEAIEQTIVAFMEASDASDATKLGSYLDDNYRIVMNRLFGSNEVSIMPKSIYLEKIKSKEFGGDDRSLTIHSITINGTTALAKASFKGKKMTFVSLLSLVKNDKGNWLLINDMPMIL